MIQRRADRSIVHRWLAKALNRDLLAAMTTWKLFTKSSIEAEQAETKVVDVNALLKYLLCCEISPDAKVPITVAYSYYAKGAAWQNALETHEQWQTYEADRDTDCSKREFWQRRALRENNRIAWPDDYQRFDSR